MNVARFLDEDRIDMDLDATFDAEHPAGPEALAAHMSTLLSSSADVVNPSKLRTDLVNRERQAASLLGGGVAMPHVRTMQARKLVMAIGISRAGLAMDTPDGDPVRLVIALVGPPYDDSTYLLVYKRLGESLREAGWIDAVVASEQPGEVIRALSR